MNIFHKVTLKTMKSTRTRTIVTIIGVILSAAMFTAVTTFCSSLLNFLMRTTIYSGGDYHLAVYDIPFSLLEELRQDENTVQTAAMQYVGYADAKNDNEYKPYFYVGAADETMLSSMPVHLTSGRLPQNDNEIILPEHYYSFGGENYSVGDTLLLGLGDREDGGFILNQYNPYEPAEEGGHEHLTVREKRAYTVVGIYERPSFENYSAPGYTALTFQSDGADSGTFSVYLKLDKVSASYIEEYIQVHGLDEYGTQVNWELLAFSGVFEFGNWGTMVYSLGTVFIFLILLGSVSLIYSAFSISVSERTRQFGLLSSVGATKRQIKSSMRFEAAVVSAIGIPLGIIVGIVGMWITFICIGGRFNTVFSSPYSVTLHVSWISILLAAVIALVTVFISAWIPCRRATRITAIDAIRQSKDIKATNKQVKTSKLTYKLFGLSGMLAKKYFKRSRKKYRATVISLTLSIILFISASSFCMYLTTSVEEGLQTANYDVRYVSDLDDMELWRDTNKVNKLLSDLSNTEGVEEVTYSVYHPDIFYALDKDLTQEYKSFLQKVSEMNRQTDFDIWGNFYYIDDASYERLVEKYNLDRAVYLDSDSPPAIVVNHESNTVYYSDSGINVANRVTYNYDIFEENASQLIFSKGSEYITGYVAFHTEVDQATGQLVEYYYPEGEEPEMDEEGNYIIADNVISRPVESYTMELGAKIPEAPLGVDSSGEYIEIIYPMRYATKMFDASSSDYKSLTVTSEVFFKSNDHEAMVKNISSVFELNDFSGNQSHFYDQKEQEEMERNFVVIVNVFSYGFIILISLIAAANVFNTISTNVSLRRRDFAMLRSVGMTRRGMNRMMNYECLLYGAKALIYGLPPSLIITFIIYRIIQDTVVTGFVLPWLQIAIAVISVFAVVGASMLYAMRKIKKDNPIDALKDENI